MPDKRSKIVKGISLISNKGFRVEFTPEETGADKIQVCTYTFSYFKGVRPALERAIKERYDFEMKTFGESKIDLSKMDEYYMLLQDNYPEEKLKWL